MKFLTTFASTLVLCSLLAHPYVDAQSAARETTRDVAGRRSTLAANPNSRVLEAPRPATPGQVRHQVKKPAPKQADEEEEEEQPVRAAPKKAATKKSATPKAHPGEATRETGTEKHAPSAGPAKKAGTKAGTGTGTKTGTKTGTGTGTKAGTKRGQTKEEAKKATKKGTKRPVVPKEPEVPSGPLEVNKCASSNNEFLDLKWVRASPFPLTTKSPLNLRIHGNFPHGLERGSKLDIFARVLFFSQTVKLDICEELETSKARVKCPLAPGIHTLQLVVPQDKLQPFKVNIQAKARDPRGKELFCFNTIMGFDQ